MIVEITSENVIDWNAKTETEKKIKQIANILKIRKGEIPFMREVGISDEFIDKPITQTEPILINEITANIYDNIEDVSILSIDILNGEIIGDFIIKVVCEI